MNNPNQNPNCDNFYCLNPKSEVRVLPTGPDSNAILCHNCYLIELDYRRYRNREANKKLFSLPQWEALTVYSNL